MMFCMLSRERDKRHTDRDIQTETHGQRQRETHRERQTERYIGARALPLTLGVLADDALEGHAAKKANTSRYEIIMIINNPSPSASLPWGDRCRTFQTDAS